jgi:peptide chain release factor 1
LQLAHLGRERRLVADGRGHAAEQRRDLGARLGEAEDVVDEEEHVLVLHVAEVLRHRQPGERDAEPRPRRLGHLSVDERGLRLPRLLDVDDARLLHLEPEIVPLAGALPDAGEHGIAAVIERDVVDELHDEHGLADARAAEEAGLAALHVRLEQVDDLDPGLEHLDLGGLLLERRASPVDRPALGGIDPPSLSTGLPTTLMTRPSVPRPPGPRSAGRCPRPACPRTMPSVGSIATVRTRFSPRCCSHLADHVDRDPGLGARVLMRTAL